MTGRAWPIVTWHILQGKVTKILCGNRLVVTADGFDQRAVDAVGKLFAQRGKDPRLADIMHLLAERCRQKLATYTTSIEEDRALLEQADTSGGMTLSIRYRLRKKELLRGVINNFPVLQTQKQ